MISRCALVALLAPLAALAQIQVFQYDGTNYTPVSGLFNVGTASPGDTIETRFRVRNTGTAATQLTKIALAGEGFAISSAPSLPYTLAPYVGPTSEAEFRVTFSPTSTSTYSAFLAVNTVNIVLQGTSAAGASLTEAGSSAPLTAGSTIDFGSVDVGASHSIAFTLSNPGSTSLAVGTLAVAGTGFSGPIGLTAPVQLAAGQTASFQVTFQPQSGQAAQGTLTVAQRSFKLTGQGLAQPLPTASIVLGSTLGASDDQNNVSISLSAASPVSGTGTLTLAFQPATGLPDDPAIAFLSGPPRVATVTIAAGDTMAKFNGQSSMQFQTGTTAGTIVFTLTLPNSTQQTSLVVTPSPVIVDAATSVRRFGAVDVSLTGFDNTYSTSQLAFTFYNLSGAVMSSAIPVNATSIFHQYFFTSNTTGGAFGLLATFPVTGDTSQIGAVDVQITNSAGITTAQKIPIGN